MKSNSELVVKISQIVSGNLNSKFVNFGMSDDDDLGFVEYPENKRFLRVEICGIFCWFMQRN